MAALCQAAAQLLQRLQVAVDVLMATAHPWSTVSCHVGISLIGVVEVPAE